MSFLRSAMMATACAAFWLLGACNSEPTLTDITVTVDAEDPVKRKLVRVNVSLYDPGATDESLPQLEQAFTLNEPNADSTRLPFSFSIVRTHSDRIKLVVKGYSDTDLDAPATIESKLVTSFRLGQQSHVRVVLEDACRALAAPCSGLERTCAPVESDRSAAGRCGQVPEVVASASADGLAAEGGVIEASSCANTRACVSPDYECVDSTTFGYQCQGQFADWHMPEKRAGAKFPADYSAGDRVVYDNVTGLTWQAGLPEVYDGCRGRTIAANDSCSWQDAKSYCSALRQADKQWRLPSKIELESLIDESRSPTIDVDAFAADGDPNKQTRRFWTSSSVSDGDDEAWSVEFIWGTPQPRPQKDVASVRCVSGELTRPGVPADRYRVDSEADTVTDTATELEWQRQVSEESFETQADAAAHCEDRGEGWRLPGAKELLTLIDPTRPGPRYDPAFPQFAPEWDLWSASNNAMGGTTLVNMFIGLAASSETARKAQELSREKGFDYERSSHVRCVR